MAMCDILGFSKFVARTPLGPVDQTYLALLENVGPSIFRTSHDSDERRHATRCEEEGGRKYADSRKDTFHLTSTSFSWPRCLQNATRLARSDHAPVPCWRAEARWPCSSSQTGGFKRSAR